MATYIPAYGSNSDFSVSAKQNFDSSLMKFLNRDNNYYVNVNDEFENIENFLTYQPKDFFEETFLTTTSKIIQGLSRSSYSENQISAAQIFINMLKKDKFKSLYPKLLNYGTAETFNFVEYLLNNNNILLAENITNTFIHPEKRTLKSFKNNIVDWCLKNTKIAALKFLINHYDGFNDKSIQSLFLSYGELGDSYLAKVFPDNIYPTSLESAFQNFFKNNSIVASKKLELVSYFSNKTDFVPKELTGFIHNGLLENTLSIESLKKYDFFEKLTSKQTLLTYFPSANKGYVNNLKNYLTFFVAQDKLPETIFGFIKNNKDNSNANISEFAVAFPDYVKSNTALVEKYLQENNVEVNINLYHNLSSFITFSDEAKSYLTNKNPDVYFYAYDLEKDKNYINKVVDYILDKKFFPNLPSNFYVNYSPSIMENLKKKLDSQELFNLMFLSSNYSSFQNLVSNAKTTLVYDIENFSEEKIANIARYFRNNVVEQLQPKKWYQLSYDKPLQLVYKDGDILVIKNPSEKVTVSPVTEEEHFLDNNSFSAIISQAKKDLAKFNQLTSQPLDFNLEFKIRSESIFMQQMDFLTQVQKLENDLKFEDLYFLKNNLGKYLIQCTETYTRALTRHHALLENPGLFKKQDNTLESQKEKIDNEALKQVALLEKELNFVKENVIKTINSDSVSDMRINTRFLEATVEHGGEDSVIKLVNAKPR